MTPTETPGQSVVNGNNYLLATAEYSAEWKPIQCVGECRRYGIARHLPSVKALLMNTRVMQLLSIHYCVLAFASTDFFIAGNHFLWELMNDLTRLFHENPCAGRRKFRFETCHTSPGNNSTPCVKKLEPRSAKEQITSTLQPVAHTRGGGARGHVPLP